jgi:hypothetical protein
LLRSGLDTRIPVEEFTALEKKLQASRPVYRKIGYGHPWVSTFSPLVCLMKTLITIISTTGATIAHPSPRIAWL